MTGIESMVRQMENHNGSADLKTQVLDLSRTMSQRVVAMRVGVSRTTVFNILRAHRTATGGNGRQGGAS